MNLTAEQLIEQHTNFIQVINKEFTGERLTNLLSMYDEFQDRLMYAPASGTDFYHNAFPGGYCDHVLRVYEFTKQVYEMWISNGATTNDFTYEELMFSALHHDLGKLGFPGEGNETYKPNESKWHRENQGKLYEHNKQNHFHNVNDLTVWTLQHYNIKTSWNEMLGMKLTDGLYDDANKMYYISRMPEAKLKTNMAYILHQADSMAARIEYDMWKNKEDAKVIAVTKPKYVDKTDPVIPVTNAQKMFADIFNQPE